MDSPFVVIIGGGVSGITMANTLKHRLNFHNFVILEMTNHIGGTWSAELNNYPGELISSSMRFSAKSTRLRC
jgi:cation diffusion facilitator CzcD-associated flavoprotein CzcO